MEDKTKAVPNEIDTSVDSSTPPVEKDTTSDQGEITQEAAQVESASSEGKPEEETSNVKSEVTPDGKRSTRQERRIQSLLEKLKATQNKAKDVSHEVVNPDNQPLITDEEMATGAIDPMQLQARLDAKLKAESANITTKVMQRLKAQSQFESTITENLNDLEATQKAMASEGNTDLDEVVAEQYRLANYTIDPYTGKEVFIPRVKMSQLYEMQKGILEKKTTARVAATNLKVSNLASESAGVVGGDAKTSEQDDLSESFERARESGSDEDWAQHLKKMGLAKV